MAGYTRVGEKKIDDGSRAKCAICIYSEFASVEIEQEDFLEGI